MKKYTVEVIEFSSTETRVIQELAEISLSTVKSIYNEKQLKIINRLGARDKKWFSFELEELKDLIKLRTKDVKETIQKLIEEPIEEKNPEAPTSKTSLRNHLVNNYKVILGNLAHLHEIAEGKSFHLEDEEE